jgi:hypothetical protein
VTNIKHEKTGRLNVLSVRFFVFVVLPSPLKASPFPARGEGKPKDTQKKGLACRKKHPLPCSGEGDTKSRVRADVKISKPFEA